MSRPNLLLVPAFTELQWTIKPQLEEWGEVATYDPPGVGEEPMPDGLTFAPGMPAADRKAAGDAWRSATAKRGLDEAARRGWSSYFVVVDGEGTPTAVRLAMSNPDAVEGIAIGHACLARTSEGERPAISKEVHAAMRALLRTDSEAFIRYGIAQMTSGSVDEDLAGQFIQRFPGSDLVAALWELLESEPEPVGEQLSALDVPLLLGQHVGCLATTDEGFEDIVAAFPEARTVGCPDACFVSPTFADAVRAFCAEISAPA